MDVAGSRGSFVVRLTKLGIHTDDLYLVSCYLGRARQCTLLPWCQLERHICDLKLPHVVEIIVRVQLPLHTPLGVSTGPDSVTMIVGSTLLSLSMKHFYVPLGHRYESRAKALHHGQRCTCDWPSIGSQQPPADLTAALVHQAAPVCVNEHV